MVSIKPKLKTLQFFQNVLILGSEILYNSVSSFVTVSVCLCVTIFFDKLYRFVKVLLQVLIQNEASKALNDMNIKHIFVRYCL